MSPLPDESEIDSLVSGSLELELKSRELTNLEPLDEDAAMAKVKVTQEVVDKIGCSLDEFRWAVGTAGLFFDEFGRMPTVDEAWVYNHKYYFGLFGGRAKPFSKGTLAAIWEDRTFRGVCYYRGMRGEDQGLDERMMMALQSVTNVHSSAGLEAKLKRVGVSVQEWNSWLNYKPFRTRLNSITSRGIKNAEAVIDLSLTSAAVKGNLEAIKYFDLRSGKFDPNKQTQLDIKQILSGVVEILSKHIQNNPDLLRAIAGDLALLAAAAGLKEGQ